MSEPQLPRSSFWSQALPLMAARVAGTLVNVVLSMVLARLLELADVGLYRQFALLSGIALQSLQLGLTTSILHFLPRADARAGRAYVGFAAVLLAVVGALSAACFFGASPWLAAYFASPGLVALALPFSIATGLFIASSPIEAVLTARGRPLAAALAQVGTEVARVVVGLVAAIRFGLPGLAWAFLVVGAVRFVASLALTISPESLRWDRRQIRAQLRFALPYGASLVVAIVQGQLHQFYVAGHVTTQDFALYSTACIQLPLMAMLFNAVGDALDVRLASHRQHGEGPAARAVFVEAMHRLMLVSWPLGAAALGAAPQLLAALYGPQFAGGGNVLRIASIMLFLGAAPSLSVLRAHGMTPTILAMNAVKLLVTWPILVVGFRWGGVLGAMAGHVCLEAALRWMQLLIAARLLGTPAARLVDWPSFARLGVGSVLIVGVAFLVAPRLASPWWICGVTGVVALAVIAAEFRVVRAASRGLPAEGEAA